MRLSAEEFRKVLESAIAGNKNDIETIIDLYLPLINRFSVINGVIDEDLRQELMIHHPEAKTISPTSRAAYHLGAKTPALARRAI